MEASRILGKSSVRVTPVIFGAWAIGGWMWGPSDDEAAVEAIRASIEHGVTTIDTAAIYGMGHSETLVGKAIAGKRERVVLATKCGLRWDTEEGADPWAQKDLQGRDITIRKNSKPASIAYECEQSLKRLGVEVIDLYQIHRPDPSTPVEESIGAMEKLRKEGKIKAIGVSNYDVSWLEKATGVAVVASLQPMFSLIQRKIEKDVLPWCRAHDVGVICYSPLERGLLAGAVGPERVFPPGDHRRDHRFFTRENRVRVKDSLAKIQSIADRHKVSLAQLVIAWTIRQPGITAAIVGSRNAEQAAHNAGALRVELSADELGSMRGAFDECSRVMMAN